MTAATYSLPSLYSRSSGAVRVDAFLKVLHFPETQTLLERAILSYYVLGGDKIDYDDIRTVVATNPNMLEFTAVEDTSIVLEVLERVHHHMALGHFDKIQVTRGGVVLLHIIHTRIPIKRSASVDIFHYRKELSQQTPVDPRCWATKDKNLEILFSILFVCVNISIWAGVCK